MVFLHPWIALFIFSPFSRRLQSSNPSPLLPPPLRLRPPLAAADISGLTPCKDSKQFAKREKQQLKKLESSLKLYAPALAIKATMEKTKRRFDNYGKYDLLCGSDGLPHLIVRGISGTGGSSSPPASSSSTSPDGSGGLAGAIWLRSVTRRSLRRRRSLLTFLLHRGSSLGDSAGLWLLTESCWTANLLTLMCNLIPLIPCLWQHQSKLLL